MDFEYPYHFGIPLCTALIEGRSMDTRVTPIYMASEEPTSLDLQIARELMG